MIHLNLNWFRTLLLSVSAAGRAPVVLAVAPNGARRTRADHPALPITPRELAAAACRDAGAAMIHFQVRDVHGRHLLDAAAYRAATAAIRAAVGDDLVIQITSESGGIYSPLEQMAVVRAVRPEAVSVALRELAPDDTGESVLAAFFAALEREHVMPQFIVYSPAEAHRLAALQQRGLIPWDDIPVLFVLGRYAEGQVAAPVDLAPFLPPAVPGFSDWMVCAFGRAEFACVTPVLPLGGHIRVGFENNLVPPDGTRAPDNAALVTAITAEVHRTGCSLAYADALRATWR